MTRTNALFQTIKGKAVELEKEFGESTHPKTTNGKPFFPALIIDVDTFAMPPTSSKDNEWLAVSLVDGTHITLSNYLLLAEHARVARFVDKGEYLNVNARNPTFERVLLKDLEAGVHIDDTLVLYVDGRAIVDPYLDAKSGKPVNPNCYGITHAQAHEMSEHNNEARKLSLRDHERALAVARASHSPKP